MAPRENSTQNICGHVMMESVPDYETVNNAKKEYLTSLTKIMSPYVYTYMKTTYHTACEAVGRRKSFQEFQRELKKIPDWNNAVILDHTHTIETKYPHLGNLIAAAFVAFIKILSSIRISSARPTMKLKVPSSDKFVHKVFTLAAKKYYENPYLVTQVRESEQRSMMYEVVENAVRDMLPMEDVLSQYLSKAVDENHTVNPVLSPPPSEQDDDDALSDPDPEPEEEEEEDHEPPKVIEYTHAHATPPTPAPPTPAWQEQRPDTPDAAAFPPPPPPSPEPPQSAFVPVPQQPQQQPQPLFPDARDGEEHFR